MVGLIPLFAVETLEPELLERVPEFTARLEWFLNYRPDLANLVSHWDQPGRGKRRLLSLLRGHRMKKLLVRMLDPQEFLAEFGVRALSKAHEHEPYVFKVNGSDLTVRYVPAESDSGLFGGNSNWRGPIWFPTTFLIIESLRKLGTAFGSRYVVRTPGSNGQPIALAQMARDIARRMIDIFLLDEHQRRPVFGGAPKFADDPSWRDHLLFYEYFHGDNGAGIGASHQTGWTALVANLIDEWR
jgi:hypothetical protein